MKKLFPVIISGAVALVCLLAALGASVDFKTSAPEKTAKKVTQCMLKGKYKKAAKYMNVPAGMGGLAGELMGEMDDGSMKQYSKMIDALLTETPQYSADKTSADVVISIAAKGFNAESEVYELVKVGNKWLVDMDSF